MARFPFPIPLGWFGMCYSHELQVGTARKIRFCGRDLVLFRTASGALGALNNYCPHLGAALHQGKVVEESIQCPFHHWQFDCQGQCVHIPYAQKIPSRAKTDTIPVLERNGMIMGWHHPENKPPHFEVQTIEAFNEPREGWGPVHYREFELPTCVQEIGENDVDQAHFPYVHNSPALRETIAKMEGPIKHSHSMEQPSKDNEVAAQAPEFEFRMDRLSHGPGSVTVHYFGILGLNGERGEFVLYNATTPVEEDKTLLRWQLTLSENIDTDDMGQAFLQNVTEGVLDDIPIWQEKQYQPHPVLCDGDGPIARYRKWFQQFYIQPEHA